MKCIFLNLEPLESASPTHLKERARAILLAPLWAAQS